MNNQKFTKRALLISVMTLVICFTMLLGTTFAWFTDSVSSGNNVIQTGRLDLEVQYTLDGENWAKLDGATDLFDGTWEPGHTEVVALKIENKGSLALKYVANMDIVKEVKGKTLEGTEIVLSEILEVSTIVQGANDVGDICVALAFMGENAGLKYTNVASFNASNVLKADQELQPNDAH